MVNIYMGIRFYRSGCEWEGSREEMMEEISNLMSDCSYLFAVFLNCFYNIDSDMFINLKME